MKKAISYMLAFFIFISTVSISWTPVGSAGADTSGAFDVSLYNSDIKSMRNYLLEPNGNVKMKNSCTPEIDAFDLVLSRRKFEEARRSDTPYKSVSNVIEKYDKIDPAFQADEYDTRRLIVQGFKQLDFSDYKYIEEIIEGNDYLYIVQFGRNGDTDKDKEMEAERDRCFDELQPNVEYIEHDLYIKCNIDITDPALQSGDEFWGREEMGADDFESYIKSEGIKSEVTIAIIGSGAVETKLLENRFSNKLTELKEDSEEGLGTLLAETIAKCTPGLANNIKIFPITSFGDYDEPSVSQTILAVPYAAARADIILLPVAFYKSDILEKAITKAINDKGIIVIAAAGEKEETGENVVKFTAAGMEDVIVVGAVNMDGYSIYNANFGTTIDVAAPGVGIPGINRKGKPNSYNGSMFSAAYIAAVAAMIKLVLHPARN